MLNLSADWQKYEGVFNPIGWLLKQDHDNAQ